MSVQSPSIAVARVCAAIVVCAAAVVVAAQAGRHDASPGAARVVQEIAPAAPFVPGAGAAPARGVTGTAELPALPVPSATTVDPSTGAAPFSLGGIAGIDRARALQCLTAAIYYEAATEGDAGQAAVAQVVLNRVRHPAFPASVCGVVYQGATHRGCQFSFACDGASTRVPTAAGWARAARAAALALDGRVFAAVGLATHYHTYGVTPAWNRSLVMTAAVGAHLFHRWKGYWGTAAAFTQRYRGDEPLVGPVAPAALQGVAVAMPMIRPIEKPSGAAIAAVPVDHLPPAAVMLDKWKNSGIPLDRSAQRDTP